MGPSTSESPAKRASEYISSPVSQTTPAPVDVPAQFAPLRARLASVAAPAPARAAWSHTPSNLTLIWLAISLPLVIWDTGYVMLRPLSMPGGSLHSPIWKPYDLYGTIDHVYGFKAWDANNGWTLAQGSVNALETAAYLLYLYWVYTYGEQESKQGRGAPAKETMGRWKALSESRTVRGRVAVWAVVLAYSTAFLTFSKTILYWLTEAFSGMSQHCVVCGGWR